MIFHAIRRRIAWRIGAFIVAFAVVVMLALLVAVWIGWKGFGTLAAENRKGTVAVVDGIDRRINEERENLSKAIRHEGAGLQVGLLEHMEKVTRSVAQVDCARRLQRGLSVQSQQFKSTSMYYGYNDNWRDSFRKLFDATTAQISTDAQMLVDLLVNDPVRQKQAIAFRDAQKTINADYRQAFLLIEMSDNLAEGVRGADKKMANKIEGPQAQLDALVLSLRTEADVLVGELKKQAKSSSGTALDKMDFACNEAIGRMIAGARSSGQDFATKVQTKASEISGKMLRQSVLVCLVSLGVMLVLLVAVLLQAFWIGRRMHQVAQFATSVSVGQVQADLPDGDSTELGQMVTVLSNMRTSLIERSSLATAVSHGDLRPDVVLASEHDGLGLALRDMVRNLRDRIRVLDQQSRNITNSAQGISTAAGTLSSGASQQAASIEEISANITEINNSIQSMASSAIESASQSSIARGEGEKNLQRMQELNLAMSEIQEAIDGITNILKTIDSFALQTNLLAINAAIEAARAGRHGRGFSVVAEEVRALAGRSAEAARQSAELSQRSLDRMSRGIQAVGIVTKNLQCMVTTITTASSLANSIAQSAQDQASAISQVRDGLGHIEKVTETNTSQAAETALAAGHLTVAAQDLADIVNSFRMPESIICSKSDS